MMPPPMMAPPPPMMMREQHNFPTLYVGDLDKNIQEDFLYEYFRKWGIVYSIRVMRDKQQRVSRGFAFVSFYNPKEGTPFFYLFF